MSKYGIPYKGNKSKIADDILNQLPSGKRLVDLFGGGFAITHCALVNHANKWESFMYNDINPLLQPLITDAIHNLIEEVADVSICLEQLIYLNNIADEVEEAKKIALEKVRKKD